MPLRAWVLIAVFAALVPGLHAGESATGLWPAVDSDLRPAPELVTGKLANGLRYLILPNAEPKGHVSLRLLVAAGSLLENPDERGLAHFVEHMAFRSTKTHPDSTLVPALQRLGVSFGPDSAAFTSYEHTIFHLDLPQASEATVRAGLGIYREFASEVTFDPHLIDIERGVILSEAKYRDTPDARSFQANLAFLWPKSRLARSPVIGDAQQVATFSRPQFAAFYDAWYRPERMVVIAVGDADPAMLRRAIAEELGGLAPRGPGRPEPTDLYPAKARPSDVDVFLDPGLIGCGFVFQHAQPRTSLRDTHADRVQTLRLMLADTMLQRRLYRQSLDPKTPFVSPALRVDEDIPGWRVVTLSASGRGSDWGAVATELEREHRRAYLYGFTAAELDAAKAAATARYAEAVRTASTFGSNWLADQLASDVRQGRVFTRPAQAQADMAPEIAAATSVQCARAFRAAWSERAPSVFVAANSGFRISPREIGTALNRSRGVAVARYTERAASQFAYTRFGPAGVLVKDEYLADLDARLVRFANGVACNFKATAFEKDLVDVHIRVGDGKRSEPLKQPGLDVLAGTMLISGGLGRHRIDAITDMLAARSFTPEFQVESDACVFSARCSERDLAFCLQLLTAYLQDAAFRADAMASADASFGSMYASMAASPGGPIALVAMRAMIPSDPRFGTAFPAELHARTMREVQAWLTPQFQHGGIEVSIVGDTTWDEVRPIVAATLGALAKRPPRHRPVGDVTVRLAPTQVAATVMPAPPQVRQSAIACYWPVAKVKGVLEERRLYLLAALFEERLRVRLRDELGATYACTAGFRVTEGFPTLNWMSCYAEVNPPDLDKAMQLIEREALSFSWHGPPADDFERGRRVYVRQMTDDLRTNGYWGSTVLSEPQEKPERLVAARNRAADIAGLALEQLVPLAGCFDPSNSYRFVTVPKEFEPAGSVAKLPRADRLLRAK